MIPVIDKVMEELEFGIATIKINPKSYGAWYNRKWLIQSIKNVEMMIPFDVVKGELKLCDRLLDIDSRNCKREKRLSSHIYILVELCNYNF